MQKRSNFSKHSEFRLPAFLLDDFLTASLESLDRCLLSAIEPKPLLYDSSIEFEEENQRLSPILGEKSLSNQACFDIIARALGLQAGLAQW